MNRYKQFEVGDFVKVTSKGVARIQAIGPIKQRGAVVLWLDPFGVCNPNECEVLDEKIITPEYNLEEM